MTTNKQILARRSKIGHYGVHYPDFESVGVVIPKNTTLTQLTWIGGNGLTAHSWDRGEGTAIVWFDLTTLATE